jgi:hypothetical protein
LQIQKFASGGVHLLANGGDTILGNSIQATGGGYDSPSDPGFGGGGGVFIEGVAGNVIGDSSLAKRNEITTYYMGVHLAGTGADKNQVLGKVIGTDGSHLANISDSAYYGVLVFNGSGNTIGGADSSSKNVLGGAGSTLSVTAMTIPAIPFTLPAMSSRAILLVRTRPAVKRSWLIRSEGLGWTET